MQTSKLSPHLSSIEQFCFPVCVCCSEYSLRDLVLFSQNRSFPWWFNSSEFSLKSLKLCKCTNMWSTSRLQSHARMWHQCFSLKWQFWHQHWNKASCLMSAEAMRSPPPPSFHLYYLGLKKDPTPTPVHSANMPINNVRDAVHYHRFEEEQMITFLSASWNLLCAAAKVSQLVCHSEFK